jgi:MoaA/NifB/PqqE/SkfB family radical SAM enzyme
LIELSKEDGFMTITSDDAVLNAVAQDKRGFAAAVQQDRLYRLLAVKIKITEVCNVRCVMCNYWRKERQPSILTRERLLALMDEIAELGAISVQWSGGEPTLCHDLPDAIGRLSDLGIESKLTTNATRMTEEYANRLKEARLARVTISIESPYPEVHDRVVGVEGAWEKATAGVARLSRERVSAPRIQLRTVLTRINTGPGLTGMVPLASRLGARRVIVSPLWDGPLAARDAGSLAPSDDQIHRLYEEYLPEMWETGRKLRVKVRDETRHHAESPTEATADAPASGPDTCYLPYYHCLISADGRVQGCCRMREGPPIGNLCDQPLARILASEGAVALRRRIRTGDWPEACRGCTMQFPDNQAITAMLRDHSEE